MSNSEDGIYTVCSTGLQKKTKLVIYSKQL